MCLGLCGAGLGADWEQQGLLLMALCVQILPGCLDAPETLSLHHTHTHTHTHTGVCTCTLEHIHVCRHTHMPAHSHSTRTHSCTQHQPRVAHTIAHTAPDRPPRSHPCKWRSLAAPSPGHDLGKGLFLEAVPMAPTALPLLGGHGGPAPPPRGQRSSWAASTTPAVLRAGRSPQKPSMM